MVPLLDLLLSSISLVLFESLGLVVIFFLITYHSELYSKDAACSQFPLSTEYGFPFINPNVEFLNFEKLKIVSLELIPIIFD